MCPASDYTDLTGVAPLGSPPDSSANEQAAQEPRNKKEKGKGGQRELLTVYRTSSRNHIALSAIADRKANFLLSVSTILSSVTFTYLVKHVQKQPVYALPGLLLIAICTITIVLVILSTMPVTGKGTFTPEEVKNKKANLLFFGNYFKTEPAVYEAALAEMLEDRAYLKSAISYDLYHLGASVARKYRFLRMAYFIFMTGTVASIILAYVAFAYRLTWFTEYFMRL